MVSSSIPSALGAIAVLSSVALSHAIDGAVFQKRAVPSVLPGSWSYVGCYQDNVAGVGRTLTGSSYSNTTTMTDESCIAFCSEGGFIYAGTEYSSECFCGATIAVGANKTADSNCGATCSGNSTESCGAGNFLSLFWSGQSPPKTNPGSGNWSFVGCYSEGIDGAKTLANEIFPGASPANMTVDLCTAGCQSAGYVLAGVEYSEQCYCGNVFSSGGAPAPATADGLNGCNMLCAGNSSEYCGGPNRLDVYDLNNAIATITATSTASAPTATPTLGIKPTVGAYTYYGCQTEGVGVRALASNSTATDVMTLEYCASYCSGGASPYKYFGTEYGRECYCGNALAITSNATANTDCSMVCAGNIYEYCGAGNRLSTYQLTV